MIVHIFINNCGNFEFLHKKLFILKDNYMHKHKRTIGDCKRGYFHWGEILRFSHKDVACVCNFLRLRLICLQTPCHGAIPTCGEFCDKCTIVKHTKFTPTQKFTHLQYKIKIIYLIMECFSFLITSLLSVNMIVW